MQRLALKLYGRVQGVGFREFVRHHATVLRLRGWVRNAPDGTVELLAAGDPDALDQLRQYVASGPPWAKVERVDDMVSDDAPLEEDFRIVR
jgi:acylphosphatase